MTETCIVCLGDFGESPSESTAAPALCASPDHAHARTYDHATTKPQHSTHRTSSSTTDVELIAQLQPCGHILHNDCLKPWVERANSCPICRQSFNKVELSATVGGKLLTPAMTRSALDNGTHADHLSLGSIISSYAVADRTQVAETDPSLLVEALYEDEPEESPCPICHDDDNEDVLMACDGCDAYYHTYCVGLDAVPTGHWFCENCEAVRLIDAVSPGVPNGTSSTRPHRQSDRRTRGQVHRSRNLGPGINSSWARVWQSVWDNLNLDLDFPYDDSSVSPRSNRRALAQRREFRAWERRLQVAQRQGGPNRFGETASALLDLTPRREQPAVPQPESQEELRAWNALEKAKMIEDDPSTRKRKSATASPSEPEPAAEPERPLKRPRTRRNVENPDTPSSDSRRTSVAGPSSSSASRPSNTPTANGPSFLQSMLREIETSTTVDDKKGLGRTLQNIATNHSSPQPSSPGASPTASNHATPRAGSTTPPPMAATRPSSPLSLTSKVEPIFLPAEYSPIRSPPDNAIAHRPHRRQARPPGRNSSPPSRSVETSPNRALLPLSTKTDLQKMVSSALKPHYASNAVNKDQYTDINRNVSRMLYDLVGDTEDVTGHSREGWEKVANDEVAKAVHAIKTDIA